MMVPWNNFGGRLYGEEGVRLHMVSKRSEKFSLSAHTIDEVSAICVQTLGEADADKKDIVRIRLSLEEILGVWLGSLENAPVCLSDCTYNSFFGCCTCNKS